MHVGEGIRPLQLARVAKKPGVRRTVVESPAVPVEDRDIVAQALGNQMKERLLLAQGLFRFLAFRNVGVCDDHAFPQRRDAHVEPALLERRMTGVVQAKVRQAPVQNGSDALKRIERSA